MRVVFTIDDIKAIAEGQDPRIRHPEYDLSIVIIFLARKLLKYIDNNRSLRERNEILNNTIQDVY